MKTDDRLPMPAGQWHYVDPELDAAEILARCWNDQLPEGDNVETISWWLRHVDGGNPGPVNRP